MVVSWYGYFRGNVNQYSTVVFWRFRSKCDTFGVSVQLVKSRCA
jgi:hypothetical protein